MKRLLGVWVLASLMTVAAEQPLRIGVSLADLGNPFFYSLAESIRASARARSDRPVAVTVVSSAYDLARQRAQIRRFVDENVDIILLSAADTEGIEPAIHLARQAGVVVTAVDIDARGADVTVTTDNVQAGELACQYLVERLDGQGRVAIINGAPVSSVTDRVAGCRAVLNDHAGIELVSDQHNGGGTHGGGLEAMTFLLSQYSRLDAVFAINDPSALGAAEAAALDERPEVLIAAVDGSPAFLDALADGQPNLTATAAQSPERMAELAVEASLARLAAPDDNPVVIRIPTRLITRASLGTD